MIDLIAGPWIGELGWELGAWQGVLRAMAPQYKRVVVYGRPGHQYLYEDFMDEYVDFTPQGCEPNMWMNKGTRFVLPEHHKNALWVKPQQLSLMPNAPEQVFARYGVDGICEGFDIVCHARSLNKYKSDYINTDLESWQDILSPFAHLSIASIGTIDGADHIPGTVDMRGISLSDLADVLAGSGVLIGPSSGPMHFGSLCKIPMVVWSGYARSRYRYESAWNPFESKVTVIDDPRDSWGEQKPWQPDHEIVVDEVEKML